MRALIECEMEDVPWKDSRNTIQFLNHRTRVVAEAGLDWGMKTITLPQGLSAEEDG